MRAERVNLTEAHKQGLKGVLKAFEERLRRHSLLLNAI